MDARGTPGAGALLGAPAPGGICAMEGLEFEPLPHVETKEDRDPLTRSCSSNGLRNGRLKKSSLKRSDSVSSSDGGRKKSVSFDDLVTLAKPPLDAPAVLGDDDLKSQCWYTYEDMRFFACAEVQRRKSLGIDTMSCITPATEATQETLWDELGNAKRWCETFFHKHVRRPLLSRGSSGDPKSPRSPPAPRDAAAEDSPIPTPRKMQRPPRQVAFAEGTHFICCAHRESDDAAASPLPPGRGFDDHAAPDGARGPTTIHLSRAVEPPLPLE